MNWNSLIITIGFTLLGFLGKELYHEVRQTHDVVIALQAKMVPREEYDLEIATLKARVATIELEIVQMKDKKIN